MNTQGGKFLKQLQRMEKDIDQTTPRFIRCVKPNQDKVRSLSSNVPCTNGQQRSERLLSMNECPFAQVPNEIHGPQCLRQLRFAVRIARVASAEDVTVLRSPLTQHRCPMVLLHLFLF